MISHCGKTGLFLEKDLLHFFLSNTDIHYTIYTIDSKQQKGKSGCSLSREIYCSENGSYHMS